MVVPRGLPGASKGSGGGAVPESSESHTSIVSAGSSTPYVGEMIEGAAQLPCQGDASETDPHRRITDPDRALHEAGSLRSPLEASRELLDRPVERAVCRLRRRQRHAAIPACRPREPGRAG